ncbi:HK97 gp10 family phage protein [Sinorhizobium meliloti]|nr:HK97 gp10 family phage protein [Sinorhizobium meliloti]WKL27190.1 HK97 gp10 family phage protein [Sinorhizobium meliloti]WKL32658.1 HK97 gp10 family phage protein [Sinorhizobium meliloti]WKL38423.1 HK97 gp10 family phage protein [Sinorhizobium meliloti]WKL42070.1 HK97 gp10 family phage protein [Sinorhizobium meliloti]
MAGKRNDGGLANFNKRMKALGTAPAAMIDKALLRSARRVAVAQRLAAPEDTGALKRSIAITAPGETTPPYSQPGGSHIADKHEVIITAGNSDVRYAHLVEHGTAETEAQPFFLNTFHQMRAREQRLIKRAGMKAIRDANAGKKTDV